MSMQEIERLRHELGVAEAEVQRLADVVNEAQMALMHVRIRAVTLSDEYKKAVSKAWKPDPIISWS